jgi:tetratricopeptide (TPR) repeat protein
MMHRAHRFAWVALSLTVVVSAQTPDVGPPQYVSADGRRFFAQPDAAGAVAKAAAQVSAAPTDVDALVALGDAYAAIWDHRSAIATYDKAIAIAPDRAVLYQQRGHRRLSNRDAAGGASDLEKAVAMDPSLAGAWYYLGLTHYLAGRYDRAASCYEKNIAIGKDDLAAAIAAVDWLYMSYRRGKEDAKAAALLARVTPDMKVEGNARLYLNRLLFYKELKTEAELLSGELNDIEKTTLSYGAGNFHFYNGRQADANRLFTQAVSTTAWPALAFIAAENDLRQLR